MKKTYLWKNPEYRRQKQKEYYWKNIEKMRKKTRLQKAKFRENNREKLLELQKKYYEKNRELIAQRAKKTRDKSRLDCLTYYGGNPPLCKCCKENNLAFLTIDHIKGDGSKESKKIRKNLYFYLRKRDYPNNYQVLCFNCNFGKWLGELCPHQTGEQKISLKSRN